MNLSEQLQHDYLQHQSRRQFLSKCVAGVGSAWLTSMAGNVMGAGGAADLPGHISHIAPKAKRVIFLHMAGAPSQLELFDYKPALAKLNGKPTPAEYLEGQRFALSKEFPRYSTVFIPSTRQVNQDNGSRIDSPTLKKSSMTSASSSRCTPISSTTRLRSSFCTPAMPI